LPYFRKRTKSTNWSATRKFAVHQRWSIWEQSIFYSTPISRTTHHFQCKGVEQICSVNVKLTSLLITLFILFPPPVSILLRDYLYRFSSKYLKTVISPS